jgi:hypothetical protein
MLANERPLPMRWLQYTTLFVDLIKGIAWPAAVVVILWLFRDQIVAQLSRVTEVGLAGVKLDRSPLPQVPAPPEAEDVLSGARGEAVASPDAAVAIATIKGAHTPLALEPTLEVIRRDLPKVATTEAEQIDVLAYVVAGLNVILSHERTYRQIFGSQIALLRAMQGLPPMSSDQVLPFYTSAAKTYPEIYRDIPFDGWLRFLILSGLCADRNGLYEITDYGRAFLKYLVDSRLTEDKVL